MSTDTYDSTGTDTVERFERAAQKVCEAGFEALIRHHHHQGPSVVAHTPGGAMYGVTVRLYDQVADLATLLQRGPANHEVEPGGFDTHVRNRLADIVMLATIGQLVVLGEWPGLDRK